MSEVIIGQYVKLDPVKKDLEITDAVDDEELLGLINDVNQDIEIKLRPFAKVLPLPDGTADFKAASRAGKIYIKARWAEKKHNKELAEAKDKLYERKMKDLQMAMNAESATNPRTKAILISKDPREEKLILPGQLHVLITDNF